MYERFTDRARKVMQLANEEARRFNHEYINTEHILLGLVKEGSGVAANVLKNLGVDLYKVRSEVEKFAQSGPDTASSSKVPHTPLAKQVIESSMAEARSLNHNYVGTEHLLLGLLKHDEGIACQVLTNLGLKLEDVRQEVLNLLGHGMQESGSILQPKTAEDLKWYLKAVVLRLQSDLNANLKAKQLSPELWTQLPRLLKEAVNEVFGGDDTSPPA